METDNEYPLQPAATEQFEPGKPIDPAEKIIQIAVSDNERNYSSDKLYCLTNMGRILVRTTAGWYEESMPDLTTAPNTNGRIPYAERSSQE